MCIQGQNCYSPNQNSVKSSMPKGGNKSTRSLFNNALQGFLLLWVMERHVCQASQELQNLQWSKSREFDDGLWGECEGVIICRVMAGQYLTMSIIQQSLPGVSLLSVFASQCGEFNIVKAWSLCQVWQGMPGFTIPLIWVPVVSCE